MAFHAKGGVSLIVGPPVSGKADTLAVIVFLGVAYGHKALLCAASNRAVNRLFRDLLNLKELCQKNKADQYVDWTKFDPIRLYIHDAELNYVNRPKSHQDLGNAGSSNEDGDDDKVDKPKEPFFETLTDFENKTWVEYHHLTSPHYEFPNHSLGAAVIRCMDQDLEDLKLAHTAAQIKALGEDERILKDPSYKLQTAL